MAAKNNEASREMAAQLREEVKQRGKAIMQRLRAEERELFLDEHPEDKGSGFSERSLLTSNGPIEGLRVPRTRSGDFHPAVLPGKRRASVDRGDLLLIVFSCGVNTRKIQQVIEAVCGAFCSPASLARMCRLAEEEVEALKDAAAQESLLLGDRPSRLPLLEARLFQEGAGQNRPGRRPRGLAGDPFPSGSWARKGNPPMPGGRSSVNSKRGEWSA